MASDDDDGSIPTFEPPPPAKRPHPSSSAVAADIQRSHIAAEQHEGAELLPISQVTPSQLGVGRGVFRLNYGSGVRPFSFSPQEVGPFLTSTLSTVFKPLSDAVGLALQQQQEREERQDRRDAQVFQTLQATTEKFSETVRDVSAQHAETLRSIAAQHSETIRRITGQHQADAKGAQDRLFTLAEKAISKGTQ